MTAKQLVFLYESFSKREFEKEKRHQVFHAALQGVDLLAEERKHSTVEIVDRETGQKEIKQVPKFGDPKEYDKLTPEQRANLTEEMKSVFESWAESKGM